MSYNPQKNNVSELEKTTNPKEFIYKFEVTEDLLDEYNHINNARYLDLYEQARWAILEVSSFGRQYVKETGIGPVIIEVTVKFRKEIKLGEIVTIRTISKIEGNRIFLFSQEMKNENDEICSTAIFKGALFDLKTRKIIKPDEKWRKALEQ